MTIFILLTNSELKKIIIQNLELCQQSSLTHLGLLFISKMPRQTHQGGHYRLYAQASYSLERPPKNKSSLTLKVCSWLLRR